MAITNNLIYNIAAFGGNTLFLNRWGSGAVTNNQNVTLYSRTQDPDQQWKVTSISGGYALRTMLNTNFGLNIYQSTKNCDLYPVSGNEADAAVALENLGGDVYRVKLVNHNLYLTASGSSSGANVSWASSGSLSLTGNQAWKFSLAFTSDTTVDINLTVGQTYYAKITSLNGGSKPNVVAGTGGFVNVSFGRQSGNDYIFAFTGVAAGETGIYVNGVKIFVCRVSGGSSEHGITINDDYIYDQKQAPTQSLRDAGCALTCGMDVASYYDNQKYTFNDFMSYWTSGGYNWRTPRGYSYALDSAPSGMNEADTIAYIKRYIDANIPAICHCQPAGSSQHWVVAYDYTSGSGWDSIMVLDPYLGRRVTMAKAMEDSCGGISGVDVIRHHPDHSL